VPRTGIENWGSQSDMAFAHKTGNLRKTYSSLSRLQKPLLH